MKTMPREIDSYRRFERYESGALVMSFDIQGHLFSVNCERRTLILA